MQSVLIALAALTIGAPVGYGAAITLWLAITPILSAIS